VSHCGTVSGVSKRIFEVCSSCGQFIHILHALDMCEIGTQGNPSEISALLHMPKLVGHGGVELNDVLAKYLFAGGQNVVCHYCLSKALVKCV